MNLKWMILWIFIPAVSFASATDLCPPLAGTYGNCSIQGASVGDAVKVVASPLAAPLTGYHVVLTTPDDSNQPKDTDYDLQTGGSSLVQEGDTPQGHEKVITQVGCDGDSIYQEVHVTMNNVAYANAKASFEINADASLTLDLSSTQNDQSSEFVFNCPKI